MLFKSIKAVTALALMSLVGCATVYDLNYDRLGIGQPVGVKINSYTPAVEVVGPNGQGTKKVVRTATSTHPTLYVDRKSNSKGECVYTTAEVDGGKRIRCDGVVVNSFSFVNGKWVYQKPVKKDVKDTKPKQQSVKPKAGDYTGPTSNKKQSLDDAIKQAIEAATPAK